MKREQVTNIFIGQK